MACIFFLHRKIKNVLITKISCMQFCCNNAMIYYLLPIVFWELLLLFSLVTCGPALVGCTSCTATDTSPPLILMNASAPSRPLLHPGLQKLHEPPWIFLYNLKIPHRCTFSFSLLRWFIWSLSWRVLFSHRDDLMN